MSSHEAMHHAEKLYQAGLISYPRTETDQFPDGFDFHALIQQQYFSNDWGDYARSLLERDGFQRPKAGKNNDQSHPPIHPTKYASPNDLNPMEQRLYEFVVRHFLACCSKDGKGMETIVHFENRPSGETFHTSGLIITEYNFLDVYPYLKWSDVDLPLFVEGETLPASVDISQGATSPPPLLTEADLIKLMDQHGIGTDATIAEHIHTVQERKYVNKKGAVGEFEPTQLGEALVAGYNFVGYRQLSQPELRSKLEKELKLIGSGQRTKDEVVAAGIKEFRAILVDLMVHAEKLDKALGRYFTDSGTAAASVSDRPNFSTCGACGTAMSLRENQNGNMSVVCDTCSKSLRLPGGSFSPLANSCPLCQFGVLEVTSPQGKTYNVCPQCYNNPPAGMVSDIENVGAPGPPTMPCFKCTADCKFAGRKGGGRVRSCPCCGAGMNLKQKKDGTQYFVGCSGYTNGCTKALWLPNGTDIESYKATQRDCPRCTDVSVKLLSLHRISSTPTEVCIRGCDPEFRNHLSSANRNYHTWETDPAAVRGSTVAAPAPRSAAANADPPRFGHGPRASVSNFGRRPFDDPDDGPPPTARSWNQPSDAPYDRGSSFGSSGRSSFAKSSGWNDPNENSGGSRWGEPPKLDDDGTPICICGSICAVYTTKAGGKNAGKKYWKCADGACKIYVFEGNEDKALRDPDERPSGRGQLRGGGGYGGGDGGYGGGYQKGGSKPYRGNSWKKGGGRGGFKKRKRGGGYDGSDE